MNKLIFIALIIFAYRSISADTGEIVTPLVDKDYLDRNVFYDIRRQLTLDIVPLLNSIPNLKVDLMSLREETLDALTQLTNATNLHILAGDLCDADLERLSVLSNLKKLSIRGGITDDGLRFLANMKKLKRLDIQSSKITGTGLAHLQELPI